MGRVLTVHMEVPGDKFAQICKERSEWERFIVYPNISVLKWLFLRHDLFRCTSSSTWGHKSLPTLHAEEFHALLEFCTLFDRSDKFIHSGTVLWLAVIAVMYSHQRFTSLCIIYQGLTILVNDWDRFCNNFKTHNVLCLRRKKLFFI